MKLTIFSVTLAGLVIGGLFTYQQQRGDFHANTITETLQDFVVDDDIQPSDESEATIDPADLEGSPVIEMENASNASEANPEVAIENKAKI